MTLDEMLARSAAVTEQDEASAARILATLNGPLPRQKHPFWRVPVALLDWQFAPAWPRFVALAGCALIGFTVGLAGVDRTLDRHEAQVATRDIGAMVFEPDSFTGPQP